MMIYNILHPFTLSQASALAYRGKMLHFLHSFTVCPSTHTHTLFYRHRTEKSSYYICINRRDSTLRDLQLIGVINEHIRAYLKTAMSPLPSRTELSKGKGSITSSFFDIKKIMCYTTKSSDRDGVKFRT